MSVQRTQTGRASSRGARIAFWVVTAFGPLAASVAWVWYGFAQLEAWSERGKPGAGDTTAGFVELMGGVPLVLAHIIGVGVLLVLGRLGYRGRGVALALIAVLVASLIGIGIAQLIYGGELFELGVNDDRYIP